MVSCRRYLAFLCLTLFILILKHALIHQPVQMELTQNTYFVQENNAKEFQKQTGYIKTIQWFDTYNNNNGLRNRALGIDFEKCKIRKCKILKYFEVSNLTDSQKMYGPLDADAVIFQGVHLGEMSPPLRRDKNQVFVFAEREAWWDHGLFHSMMSPKKPHKNAKVSNDDWFSMQVPDFLVSPAYYTNTLRFRGVFNWTMTYRQDSDIPMLYGQVLHKKFATHKQRLMFKGVNEERSYDTIFKSKTSAVVWLVSHCSTKSKRENYVEKLKQYIKVDVIGQCGEDLCPKKGPKCREEIIRKYKFVLSFENTFHKDYVTEKLFGWYSEDIIPVVYGMADYKNIVPNGTIINAADFDSPKLLANYLNYVGSSREIYSKFLWRKKHYFSVQHDVMQQKSYCQLCDWLHNLNAHRKSYPEIDKWWQVNDTSAYIKLNKQAVPSVGSYIQKYWLWLILLTLPIFALCFIITCICRKCTCRRSAMSNERRELKYLHAWF